VVLGTAALGGVAGVFVAATLVLGGGDTGSERRLQQAADDSFVYAGNCDNWTSDYEGIPLCGPLADDEVRFTVDIQGARVTIDGLAGTGIEALELELADGAGVRMLSGPPNTDTDGGGRFTIDGTYVSPPARLHVLAPGNVRLTPKELAGLGPADWPAPVPSLRPSGAGYSHSFVWSAGHECLFWHFPTENYDCVAGVQPHFGSRRAGENGEFTYLGGVESDEYERIIVGFDDGSLRETIIDARQAEDGAPFITYTVLAEPDRERLTMTRFLRGGKVQVEALGASYRLPRPSAGDVLAFDDRDVAIAANREGCLSVGPDMGPWLGTCVNPAAIRQPAAHPLVGHSVGYGPPGTVRTNAIVNPQVAAVEVVDADGNVYREEAQTIPSSAHGLKFVYFDRAVAAPARDLRAIGANGEVLAVEKGALDIGR
jgi:hypothetical protein